MKQWIQTSAWVSSTRRTKQYVDWEGFGVEEWLPKALDLFSQLSDREHDARILTLWMHIYQTTWECCDSDKELKQLNLLMSEHFYTLTSLFQDGPTSFLEFDISANFDETPLWIPSFKV